MKPISVLFVCLGNICRSPSAEGVFRNLVEQQGLGHVINTDSAGTAAYHSGEAPDERAQAAALNRGVDISDLRARKVSESDFNQFDYILAADHQNLEDLLNLKKMNLDSKSRIMLFMDFLDGEQIEEIPDPYYGGPKGFEQVLDMCETASKALLSELKKDHHIED